MSGDEISDLWDAVNDLRSQQGQVLVTLGRIEAMLKERCEARGRAANDLEARVRALEATRWMALGMAALVGLAAQFVGKLFGK